MRSSFISSIFGVALAAMAWAGPVTADEVAPMPGDVFKDCEVCPEMVVIPPGEFMMGALPYDEKARKFEKPRKPAVVEKAFAIGKFEVTRTQFMGCVEAGGCSYEHGRPYKSQSPVTDLTWAEARKYAVWLSEMTGRNYRLLTEPEWEYAARAGTTTIYWWGNEMEFGNEYCTGCQEVLLGRYKVTQIGRFRPNPFGLYDMLGNAKEMLVDCWTLDHDGTLIDGDEAGPPEACGRHTVRGGSIWSPNDIRASRRTAIGNKKVFDYIGFRVGADLSVQ